MDERMTGRWLFFIAALVLLMFVSQGDPQSLLNRIDMRVVVAVVMGLSGVSTAVGPVAWRDRRVILAAFLAVMVAYGLAPAGGWLIGQWFAPMLGTGLYLAGATLPTMGLAVLWTRLAGGDDRLASVLSAILAVVGVPAMAGLFSLAPIGISFPFTASAETLLCWIILPLAAGQWLRTLSSIRAAVEMHGAWLERIGRFLVFLLVVLAALKTRPLLDDGLRPWSISELFGVAAACLVLHLGLWGTAWLIGRRIAGPSRAIAVAFTASQKSFPAGLLLLFPMLDERPELIVPLLLFHALQFVADTYVADRLFQSMMIDED